MNKAAMGGKYATYPEYKDSGSSFLEDIPIHWQLAKVKYVAELTPKNIIIHHASIIDKSIIGRFWRCICAM